jgi:hypothetical protein
MVGYQAGATSTARHLGWECPPGCPAPDIDVQQEKALCPRLTSLAF